MARNCLADGNLKEYKKYFFEQIYARENHYKEIIRRSDEFYKQYHFRDVLVSILKLIYSKFNGLIWGHGESIINIVFSSFIIIISTAILYLNSPEISSLKSSKIITSFYVSLCNFLTLSCDVTFEDTFFKFVTVSEGFVGIIITGLFVTALFKNINIR